MDDGFIYYIILAAIALLSQLLTRKKPSKSYPTPTQGGGSPKPKKKPFSFEDILKEFEAEILEKERPAKEIIEEKPTVVEAQVLETSEAEMPDISERRSSEYESYEGSSFETYQTDNEEISSKIKRYKRDDHYEVVAENLHPIIDVLYEKDGLQKAIILKEILDKKYV